MIKENFVPLEEAKALKEIGFKELCVACYDGSDMLSTYSEIFKPKNYNTGSKNTSAPLYQQALKYFRDKHNLIGVVQSIFENSSKYTIKYIYWITNMNEDGDDNLYDTWEEAELACLRKLIEIVKQQQII